MKWENVKSYVGIVSDCDCVTNIHVYCTDLYRIVKTNTSETEVCLIEKGM